MSFAITARAPQLNAEVFAKPVYEVSKFPPPPPDPTALAVKGVSIAQSFGQSPQSLRRLADEWCGTVPKHLPFPLPPKGTDDGGWCGTVPHRLPHVPPPPPQPWQDLASAAQMLR